MDKVKVKVQVACGAAIVSQRRTRGTSDEHELQNVEKRELVRISVWSPAKRATLRCGASCGGSRTKPD